MTDLEWWQRGVIYQVYPRSFQDSGADGVGDLRGILARMDYLSALGIDALWLSPVFPSPMADFGYDVADYCGVDPIFGTLADLDLLVAEAHRHGLKLLLDFVPNHSSDQHPWFLDSKTSREAAHRDWYIWRDPAPGGGAPNNWESHFGGSAWEFDPATGQYFLHSFLKEQPDLNWRNPAVVTAMLDVLRFWFDRGIDGFRIDVLWLLVKDAQFRDNPRNPDGSLARLYDSDRPETLEMLERMRSVADKYGHRVLIGEIYLPIPRLMAYYGPGLAGAQMPFNFQLLQTVWSAEAIAKIIASYETDLPPGAWPNWVLGNHDQPRIATRIGTAQIRTAAMLLLTLRGTPTIYYGEELGLENVPISPDQIRDPAELRQPGMGQGRDPERTPMPWDCSVHSGFSTNAPWLPIGGANAARNVGMQTMQTARPSTLAFYRALLAVRRGSEVLVRGATANVHATGDVLCFERNLGEHRVLVALNLGPRLATIPISQARIVIGTEMDRTGELLTGHVPLRPNEGLVMTMEA